MSNNTKLSISKESIGTNNAYIYKYFKEKYDGELDAILKSLKMTKEELASDEKQRDLVLQFRLKKADEIEASKPKIAKISSVRKEILKQKSKLSSNELRFIDGLKGKRKLTIKQEKWLRDIAKRLSVEIVGDFANRLSAKEKYNTVTNVCNCDMCVAERNGSESAGYFGTACSKWR